MDKMFWGVRLSETAVLAALMLLSPDRGANAAMTSPSPFGGGTIVADSALASMRGGFDHGGQFIPFGLDVTIESFANNHEIASLHIDNGGGGPNGHWTITNDNFNKTIDVTNLAGQGGAPLSTTVSNLLTSSAIITQIQNSQPNADLSTLQTVNAVLSGGGLAGVMKDMTNAATQAALLNVLKHQ